MSYFSKLNYRVSDLQRDHYGCCEGENCNKILEYPHPHYSNYCSRCGNKKATAETGINNCKHENATFVREAKKTNVMACKICLKQFYKKEEAN